MHVIDCIFRDLFSLYEFWSNEFIPCMLDMDIDLESSKSTKNSMFSYLQYCKYQRFEIILSVNASYMNYKM